MQHNIQAFLMLQSLQNVKSPLDTLKVILRFYILNQMLFDKDKMAHTVSEET